MRKFKACIIPPPEYAIGTNSATAGLHLAMKVMNIEGEEVISTPMTFISTNHAILYKLPIRQMVDNVNYIRVKK